MTQARGAQEETLEMYGPGLTFCLLTAVAASMFHYGKFSVKTHSLSLKLHTVNTTYNVFLINSRLNSFELLSC